MKNTLEWFGIDLHLHSPRDENHDLYNGFIDFCEKSSKKSISEYKPFTDAIYNGLKLTKIKLIAISDHNQIHYDDIKQLNEKFKDKCHFLYATELTFIQKNNKPGDIIFILDDDLTEGESISFIKKTNELIQKRNNGKTQKDSKDVLHMQIEDIEEILKFLYSNKINFIISPHTLKTTKALSDETIDYLEEQRILHASEAGSNKSIRGLLEKIKNNDYTLSHFGSDNRQKYEIEKENIWANNKNITYIYSAPSFEGLLWTVYKDKSTYTKHLLNNDKNIKNFFSDFLSYKDYTITSIEINGSKILLDRYFNSITGVRGSGKSAIAAEIGLEYDCRNVKRKSKSLKTPIKIIGPENLTVNVIAQKLFSEYSGYYNDFGNYFKSKKEEYTKQNIENKFEKDKAESIEEFSRNIYKLIDNQKGYLNECEASIETLTLDKIFSLIDNYSYTILIKFDKFIRNKSEEAKKAASEIEAFLNSIETQFESISKYLDKEFIESIKPDKEGKWVEEILLPEITNQINNTLQTHNFTKEITDKIIKNKSFLELDQNHKDADKSKYKNAKSQYQKLIELSIDIDNFEIEENEFAISIQEGEWVKNNTKLLEMSLYKLLPEKALESINQKKLKFVPSVCEDNNWSILKIKQCFTQLSKEVFKQNVLNENILIERSNQKTVIHNGKDMQNASPGEWAEFMMKEIVEDLGEGVTPIVFDQPDDDLDNKTIYNELIVQLKKLVKNRQVIVITHNANIVFNCDSSQNILCYKEDGIYNVWGKPYELMNKKEFSNILMILEGGETAFKKRREKYNAKIYY